MLRHLGRQYVGAKLGVDALPDAVKSETARVASAPALLAGGQAPDAQALHKLLKRYDGSVEKLAGHFGRHRKQIYRWLERAGIDEPALREYRRGPEG